MHAQDRRHAVRCRVGCDEALNVEGLHDAVDSLRYLEARDERAGIDVELGVVRTMLVAGDDGDRLGWHEARL